MAEIGGYIEIDTYSGSNYHEGAVALNCGRNALAYLIKAKAIRKLHLPYYCCESVSNICKKFNVEIEYYHINEAFRPLFERKMEENEVFYLVNYYGQISNEEIGQYKKKYRNIIVDNAQSYFQCAVSGGGVDTLYICRKFFGVPDGAFLYTDKLLGEELEVDESYKRMNYLLGRFERTAQEFYEEFVDNENCFENEPVKKMSRLTNNLLQAIDYEKVKKIRTLNFRYLDKKLSFSNRLSLSVPEGAFMYPYYCSNGEKVRRRLLEEKIYIPVLWPNVLTLCHASTLEYDMAKNILPLPVDQRYGYDEMEIVLDKLMEIGTGEL